MGQGREVGGLQGAGVIWRDHKVSLGEVQLAVFPGELAGVSLSVSTAALFGVFYEVILSLVSLHTNSDTNS